MPSKPPTYPLAKRAAAAEAAAAAAAALAAAAAAAAACMQSRTAKQHLVGFCGINVKLCFWSLKSGLFEG